MAALDRVQNGEAGQTQFAADAASSAVMSSDVEGLYATYLGGTDGPLVPGINSLGSAGKADAYARLLAVLAAADAEALPPVTAPVVLVKRTERGEIGRRWEDVEGFRSFFRAQPAG